MEIAYKYISTVSSGQDVGKNKSSLGRLEQ